MKHSHKTLFCLFIGLAVWAGANAITADSSANPYQAIFERNVFGLKPPRQPEDTKSSPPPAPKITLTGIFTMFGSKLALFKVQMPSRPPDAAHEQSFILGEGQRDGEIKVLEIDDQACSVKVSSFGTVMTVAFDKDT